MARGGKLKGFGANGRPASEPLDHSDGFVYAWGERRRSKPRRIAAKKAATMVQIKRHHPTDAAVGAPGALDSVLASTVAQAGAVAGGVQC